LGLGHDLRCLGGLLHDLGRVVDDVARIVAHLVRGRARVRGRVRGRGRFRAVWLTTPPAWWRTCTDGYSRWRACSRAGLPSHWGNYTVRVVITVRFVWHSGAR
jgi:hypothetical protein